VHVAFAIIILNIHWWLWALLCFVWKLPNLSWRPVSTFGNTTMWKCRKIQITRCKKSKFYLELVKIWINNPDKPTIFLKKNSRNHTYHHFYPVLVKIQINRIHINRGLLYSYRNENIDAN